MNDTLAHICVCSADLARRGVLSAVSVIFVCVDTRNTHKLFIVGYHQLPVCRARCTCAVSFVVTKKT